MQGFKLGAKWSRQLFRAGWYLNIVLVVIVLLTSAYYLADVMASGINDQGMNTTMMIGMLVIACILLMGAGISRYESMSLQQHLDIMEEIRQIKVELAEIRKSNS